METKRQSMSTWRAQKAILEKVQKVRYYRSKLEVQSALERHLDAKLEFKMASKCALADRIGAQVQLTSPPGQHKSTLGPNLEAQVGIFPCVSWDPGLEWTAQEGI